MTDGTSNGKYTFQAGSAYGTGLVFTGWQDDHQQQHHLQHHHRRNLPTSDEGKAYNLHKAVEIDLLIDRHVPTRCRAVSSPGGPAAGDD